MYSYDLNKVILSLKLYNIIKIEKVYITLPKAYIQRVQLSRPGIRRTTLRKTCDRDNIYATPIINATDN